jgi:hypothetical protein
MKIEIVVAPQPQSLASRVAPPPATAAAVEVAAPARLVPRTLFQCTWASCSLVCEGMEAEEVAEEDDEVEVGVVAKATGHPRALPILMPRWRFATPSTLLSAHYSCLFAL